MKAKLLPGLAAALLFLSVPSAGQSEFVNWETPHVHPLALTPDGTRLLAVNLPDNRLEVFAVAAGVPAPILSIPVGLDPVSVRCRNDAEAWVVNQISDTVSIVDLCTGQVVHTLQTDDEPADVVFAGVPERAFVSCSQANTVLVFDPAVRGAAPLRIPILGEDPRALAVSPSGDEVYVAVFESGNRSTALGGGALFNLGFPPNVVNDNAGPYAGTNPPPNAGPDFIPAIDGGLPAPPAVGLIVKQSAAGQWMDDNGGDWTSLVSGAQAGLSGRPVGWTLLDHDLAVIDTGTLALSYVDHLLNVCMALGVNPVSGELALVGSDATNEVRFEPNLSGRFIRVNLALVDPVNLAVASIVDLNPHLDYSTGTVDQGLRDMTLSDPRGIAWNAAGTRAYVTGMGTNNVVVIDAVGDRGGIHPTIEVGEGPTGTVLDESRERLYVLNKFAASISVIDTTLEVELTRVPFHDPTPRAILVGRKHLYDARGTGGLGLTSCASCHVDARMDRLAWDLGDPSGEMSSIQGQNLGAGVPGLDVGFEDWHPMKGPMLTQTLQDIIGKEPHHWRGDRSGLEAFNPAFVGLLGDDEMLSAEEMAEFEDFLATIFYPPNPFRNFDNTMPADLPLPGHFTTGDFGPAGQPLPNGDATRGRALFRPPNLLDGGALSCVACHTRPTGMGTDTTLIGNTFQPIAPGPDGERHHALVAVDGSTNVTLKVPQLRNLYERTGFELTQPDNVAGFGFIHDGTVDSLARFVSEPVFSTTSDQDVADLVAFLLAFGGWSTPLGSPTNPQEPPGTASQATHAAVGQQLTLAGPPDPLQQALLDAMLLEADQGDVGLVAKGRRDGLRRGWAYLGAGRFQSDRRQEVHSLAELVGLAGAGAELTFTVVPPGSQIRIGVDRDLDRAYDRDELDARSDPADKASRPKIRRRADTPPNAPPRFTGARFR